MSQYKIALIDHYDSFSFNVLDWLAEAGFAHTSIRRVMCDSVEEMAELKNKPLPTVFGPGPKSPRDLPLSVHLANSLMGVVPLFGVCLGHQIFGVASGAMIIKAQSPWHGKAALITYENDSPLFAGIESPAKFACYHSLVIERESLSPSWRPVGFNGDNEIMAMQRLGDGPAAWSVQFHPESFLSSQGLQIGVNWKKTI